MFFVRKDYLCPAKKIKKSIPTLGFDFPPKPRLTTERTVVAPGNQLFCIS
jgi:hypothetical protein